MSSEFRKDGGLKTVDAKHNLVFGYALVDKKNGKDVYDLHGDNITEDAMIVAAEDFAMNSRMAKEMHRGDAVGAVPFVMPITKELRDFIKDNDQTGLLIGMKLPDEVLAKFESGEYTGFSIGGKRITDEFEDGEVVDYA